MRACRRYGPLCALLGLSALSPTHGSAQAAPAPLPIRAAVLHRPTVARADGRSYLVYELHLTNYTSYGLTLDRVDVLAAPDSTVVLRTFTDGALRRNLRLLGPPADSARPLALDAGRTAVLYVWAPALSQPSAPTALPPSLRHRVTVRVDGRPTPVEALTQSVAVDRARPIVIAPPVKGSGWIAGVGPDPDVVPPHDRLIYPSGGHVYHPQRFATDWTMVGANGKLFRGDSARNENYFAYDQPIFAVDDGVVRRIQAGVADNVPPNVTERMTLQTVAGNYVLLELAGGGFAFYGHLAPGSIRVREGQRVRRGAQLGRVGNSGNSTGPHLHFHVIDAPSGAFIGAAEGLPFVFERFEVVGRITYDQFDATDRGVPIGPFPSRGEVRTRDLPLGGTVVNF